MRVFLIIAALVCMAGRVASGTIEQNTESGHTQTIFTGSDISCEDANAYDQHWGTFMEVKGYAAPINTFANLYDKESGRQFPQVVVFGDGGSVATSDLYWAWGFDPTTEEVCLIAVGSR
jgi:hypothetical protein